MNKYLLFLALTFLTSTNVEANAYSQYKIPRTQVIPIPDTANKKLYELYIKLPENYEQDSDTQYPVIYFADAIWHIETLSAATAFLLEDVILVGISWQQNIDEEVKQQYGEHASRFNDYSFWETPNPDHPKLTFGNADKHLAFIRNDVFKYVETTYQADSDNRTFFGYSLSGLFGTYTLMTQPDTFTNYIVGSPSVQLLTKYDINTDASNIKQNANVFISNGNLEEGLGERIEVFLDALQKNTNKKLSVTHAVIKGDHQTAFPETGVQSVTWLADILRKGDK